MELMHDTEWHKMNLGRLAVALGSTSILEGVLYHPWWVLKTREQVECGSSAGVWRNSWGLAKRIWKKEGLKALYRGFWPGTVGSLPSGYLYLIVYHKSKHDLSQPSYPQTIRTWSPFLAGAIAEAASIGLFVPIDVVTQRMQLAQTSGRNFLQISSELVKNEGFLGLYRGTALTALKLGIGSGIWWIFYEYLKPSFAKFRRDPNSYGTEKLSGFLAGFFAGIASTITTNPLDVVKTRIQTQVCLSSESTAVVPYKSVLDGFKRIWKTEGWKGVNRGLIPKLVSQGPLSAVWAFVYEFVLSYSISG